MPMLVRRRGGDSTKTDGSWFVNDGASSPPLAMAVFWGAPQAPFRTLLLPIIMMAVWGDPTECCYCHPNMLLLLRVVGVAWDD
eukprot:4673197-Alexandrium_andersonii.AAC.1